MPEPPPTSAELTLEKSGLEFLRLGKFRKARDAFKSLRKFQPARALPLLIQANLGLANEMMSKGLVSEANQVIAYLKTIAPSSYDLTLADPANKKSSDAWSPMVPLAVQRLASDAQPDDRIRAADEIILGSESPDHPGHPDAKAILSALEIGYSSEATERTAPLLRSVPRSSPFSHWVFFFKGMTALESGDHARAADCFQRVPKNSLLQASLPALLTVCGDGAASHPTTHTVHALCSWAGHPSMAEPLLQAEPLWRKKRRPKALALLTKKIPNLLCWGAWGFKADLTRLLTSEYVTACMTDREYCETMLDHTTPKPRRVARAVVDQAFFTVDFSDYGGCAHNHFKIASIKLDDMSRAVTIPPAMLSRIFTRLAEAYMASVKKDPDDLCSPPNARKALEQAIKHDPDHLHAWLTQCDLLAMGRDTSAYHRFVDDLTKRFPEEKEVLIRNGDCCIGRGAHTKALRNFEKAAKIDSVDPRIAHGILRARLGIAEVAYKKRNFSKVDWNLIESLASTNKSCPEFSLWRLRAHQLVLEARSGRQKRLSVIAAASLPLAPGDFRFEVACRIGIAKYQQKFKSEVLEDMFPDYPEPQSLDDFLAVIDEAEAFEDGPAYDSARSEARVIFTEHEERLLECIVDRKDLNTLLIKVFSGRVPNLGCASPAIEAWFAKDPSDLVLRYLCSFYSFPWLTNPRREDLHEISLALRDSPDRDDQRLLMLFERNRQRLIAEKFGDGRQGKPNKLDLDYDPHEDDDEDYDEDYDDEGVPMEALGVLDRALENISPADLEAALADILRGGEIGGLGGFNGPAPKKPTPPKPIKPPAKPPAPPAAPDPNQLNFESLFQTPPKP